MTDSPADQELADRYRRYNALCNAHDFDRLGELVAEDPGQRRATGLTAYAACLITERLGRRRPAGGAEPAPVMASLTAPERTADGAAANRWTWAPPGDRSASAGGPRWPTDDPAAR